MDVVATAGHVDHGKSALVRALTGMEPDRWAEERRRGMTIDLGFAWTRLPSGRELAFVDVPGHERFVGNMLAGVGAAPAILFVVAADEGWQPQAEEHLRVVAALGVPRVLIAVTKCDLADPGAAREAALAHFAGARVDVVGTVAVSASTGAGLAELAAALDQLVAGLPSPDQTAPVRLWVDRAFTITGAGTVVTGTLGAGTLRVGDELTLTPADDPVVVRGLQTQGRPRSLVAGTARVAVNLRGVDRADAARGMALVTPAGWLSASAVDVVVDDDIGTDELGTDLVAHIGAAAVPVRGRRLADGALRLQLSTPLPLHLGDRLLLRDPHRRRVAGADVAAIDPAPLRRRGDARRIGVDLAVPRSSDDVVHRDHVVHAATLRMAGLVDVPLTARLVGDWWISTQRWDHWQSALRALVHGGGNGAAGIPLESVRRQLDAPSIPVVVAVAASLDGAVVVDSGRVRSATATAPSYADLTRLTERLAIAPLDAPSVEELRTLDPAALAHGVRIGQLLHLGHGIYVGAQAPRVVASTLESLPQPFTVSAARQALGASRRVVLPMLEHLDAARVTRRLEDGTRRLLAPPG